MVQSMRAESPLTHEKSSHPGRIAARSYERSASKFPRATRAGTHVLDVDRGNWRPMQAKMDGRQKGQREATTSARSATARCLIGITCAELEGPRRSPNDRRPPTELPHQSPARRWRQPRGARKSGSAAGDASARAARAVVAFIAQAGYETVLHRHYVEQRGHSHPCGTG